MKKLICIYTCEKDKKSLCNFKQTNLYNKLQNDKNTKILEVYAGSNKTQILGNKLLLECEENYASLSIKTYKMIKTCNSLFEFEHLIKIDCNIFEYINTNYGYPYVVLDDFLNEDSVTNLIVKNTQEDYTGLLLSQTNNENSLYEWAKKKNIKVNQLKHTHCVPFFTGKIYKMNRLFCDYIELNGKSEANYFAKNYGGAEDLYIGYMYTKFKENYLQSNLILNYITNAFSLAKNQQSKNHMRRLVQKCDIQFQKDIEDEQNCINSDYYDESKFKRIIKQHNNKLYKLKTILNQE
jgi:hypothetical protein